MTLITPLPMSHQLAAQCGVDSTNVQRMKASFLGEDEEDESIVGRRLSMMTDRGKSMNLSMVTIDGAKSMGFSMNAKDGKSMELSINTDEVGL